jgi:hypothetical protein
MNRQKLILCLLLAAFAGSLAYSFLRSPKEQRVAALKYRPGAVAPAPRKQGAAPGPAEAGGLHLELLDRELPRFAGFRRNIFSPIFREELKAVPFKPLPPPPLPVKALPPPPPPQQQQQVLAPPPPPPLPPPDEIELAKFTFLGFLKKNGEKTVFLSSNNEIFLAKKGSNVGTKFQVSDLTDDAITIRTIATGRELVIPLVENRALSTRRTSQKTP